MPSFGTLSFCLADESEEKADGRPGGLNLYLSAKTCLSGLGGNEAAKATGDKRPQLNKIQFVVGFNG